MMGARWRSPREWKLSLTVAPWIASVLMRIGMATFRREDIGRRYPESCLAKGERLIVTFWHGRLLMMPFVFPGQTATILISHHRDGEYITRIAERLGYTVVRGSATRGGAHAFKQLLQCVKEGSNVAITPDGPKGPRHQVKSGVIELSRLSGMPILPVAFGAWPRTILKSWDEFLVPHPLARAVYVWGEPIYVPEDADKEAVEKLQSLLTGRLEALVAEADTRAANG